MAAEKGAGAAEKGAGAAAVGATGAGAAEKCAEQPVGATGAGAVEKCAEQPVGAAAAGTAEKGAEQPVGATGAGAAEAPAADTPSELAVRQMLAVRSGTRPEDWHLTFKARQAMRVACDAIAAAGGREVATQLFTCCTAVDPITSAGLVPRFCDIDPDTLAIPAALAGEPSAVMLQHTCGLMASAADAALASAAHARGAVVLEDCAHCVGRLATDAEGKPFADLSFHSFGVEKMLPTHFGGAVWVNPEFAATPLGADVIARLEALPVLGTRRAKAARHYLNQIRVLNHLPAGISHALRRRLTASGAFEPAIGEIELAGGLASGPERPGDWVCDTARAALAGLDANEAQRREAVAAYCEEFADVAGVSVPAAAFAGEAQPLLRFPVFLEDTERADVAIKSVRAAGLYAVAWYREPLFPGVTKPEAYGWDGTLAAWPKTARACEGAVSLPTDVAPERAREVAHLVIEAAR